MKTTQLVALGLAGLATVALASQTADAYESPMTETKRGTVNFNVDFTVEPPGESTDASIVPPTPGPGDEDLKLIYALDFDFGDQEYNQSAVTYNANPHNFPTAGGGSIKAPLGASVGNSSEVGEWKLTLTAGQFVSQDGKNTTMDAGMQMKLNDVSTRAVVGTQATAAISSSNLVPGNAVTLGTYTGSTSSTNNFSFGTSASVNAGTYNGVQLEMPAGLDIKGTSYDAPLVWTLTDSI